MYLLKINYNEKQFAYNNKRDNVKIHLIPKNTRIFVYCFFWKNLILKS